MVADPLTLYDCCPTSDGASAVILVADHLAHKFTDTPVWVKGSGAGSDHLALHDRPSITQLRATQSAAAKAYKTAGISASDVDLAEVHDCFTIAEVLATEDLGFAGRGLGGAFAREGQGRRNEGVSQSMRVVDSNQKATHLERLELVKRLKSSNNCVIKSNLSDKYAMQKSD